jgi:hypothetical protein
VSYSDEEDGQPNVPVELRDIDTLIPPPAATPDTDPAMDPVLAGLLAGVDAIHRLVANIALKVDALEHQVEHAVDEARSARSAAVVAADVAKAIRGDLNAEHVQVMKRLDELQVTFSGALIALDNELRGQRHVLHEHQREIDDLKSAPMHAANGNGTA